MNSSYPPLFGVLICLLSSTASAAEAESRDLRVVVEGRLFDQETALEVATIRYELPGMEWRGQDGVWNIELGSGSGHAEVRHSDGTREQVPLEVRMSRYAAESEVLEGGIRRWPFRGDLYLISRKYPLVEAEFDMRIAVPNTGATRDNGAVPAPLPGEAWHPFVVRMMTSLPPLGSGGGLLYGLNVPMWGRKVPPLTYMGFLFVKSVSAKPSKKNATERDGDMLLGRIQYVMADYPRAVREGQIINQAEYAEQIRLLAEARVLADRLAVPIAVRDELDAIRQLVDNWAPGEMVAASCRQLNQDLLRTLWFFLTPPEPGSMDEGARVYAASCAVCHGEHGDGKTPRAAELDPPPAPFAEAGFVANLSPFRAYQSISGGMPGTAMPAFESSLSIKERWSLAFYVFSFYHQARAAAGEEALARAKLALSMEEMTLRTDEELAAWLSTELPAAEVPLALSYLRTEGVARAAASPLYAVRLKVQRVGKLYASSPEIARAEMRSARQLHASLSGAIRIRDNEVAHRVSRALGDLEDGLARGAREAEVRSLALGAVDVLSVAEGTLAQEPQRGRDAFTAVLLDLARAGAWAVLFLVLLALSGRGWVLAGGALGLASGLALPLPSHVLLALLGLSGLAALVAIFRVITRKPPLSARGALLCGAAAWLAVHAALQRMASAFHPWWVATGGDKTAPLLALVVAAMIVLAILVLALRWPRTEPQRN